MQVVNDTIKSSRYGSYVTVNNEGSGIIEINGNPKSVVNFATDIELDRMLQDAKSDSQNNGLSQSYDLTDALNMEHAKKIVTNLISYIKHKPILQIGAESPIILQEGESITVPVYYWGDGELEVASNDPLTLVTVSSSRSITISRTMGARPEAIITVNVTGSDNYIEDSGYIKVAKGYRYGFRIEENNSDPYSRVSYMYDAVGMVPAHMDFTNGVFDYGSWKNKWFVKDNKPLMLRSDATVDYYLDPNNYDFTVDGLPSDVSNIEYDGNAMAQFPLCWLKMWNDGNYNYCIISDVQWDEDYKAYAHTRADGSIANYFYWSMFGGSGNSSKIRSLSGQALSGSLTIAQQISGCQANGAKWYTHTWSQRTLITGLLTLMGKSTDTQAAFGNGNCRGASSASGILQTGTLKDKGQFFGYNANNQQVKVFHVEKPWGDQRDATAGLIHSSGKIYVKMTPEGLGYRVNDVNEYTNTNISLTGNTSGYIKNCKCTEYGFIPTNISGSATTYYCDNIVINSSQLNYCSMGGGAGTSASAGGVFASLSNNTPGSSHWSVGCGLSCEMPVA